MANMAHGYDHVDFIIHVKSAVVDDKMRKCMGPTKTTTRMSPNRLVCFLLFADPESLNILVGWNHQGSKLQVDDHPLTSAPKIAILGHTTFSDTLICCLFIIWFS